MPIINKCNTDAEISSTFDVMKQLRPDLKRETYLSTVREMEKQGYCLAACFEGEKCVSVAGFRLQNTLFRQGKAELYVNDLVTDKDLRSKKYGELLFNWLKEEAKRQKAVAITLDSGIHRKDAHRFYEQHGMKATSLHFFRPSSPEPLDPHSTEHQITTITSKL